MRTWAFWGILICDQLTSPRLHNYVALVLGSLVYHVFQLVATHLIELLLYQLLFLEPLNGLELFNHLLARLPGQVSILEVLHRGLIHVHRAEALAKVFIALPDHKSLTVTVSIVMRDPAHLYILVWRLVILIAFRKSFLLILHCDLAFSNGPRQHHSLSPPPHDTVDDSNHNKR